VPVSSISAAVATMDEFYTLINEAQTIADFIPPWNMFTLEEQCHSPNNCDIQYFYDRWWPSKVYYRLYDCGLKTVTAEEMIYPRGSNQTSLPADPKYWTYELVEGDEGTLLISGIHVAQKPGEGCVLVIERVPQP
jgi:hypothetical protein